tara:strand:+ start:105 stop:779 length:675 start_codon:yes stop_codon:yes gene_type:complete
MDSNRFILIVLATISFLLTIPKIKKHSLALIIITALVGYSVTKNTVISLSVAAILGSIFTSLENTPLKIVKRETFTSNKRKKKEEDEEEDEDESEDEDTVENEDEDEDKDEDEDEDKDEDEADDEDEDEDDAEDKSEKFEDDVEEDFNIDSKGSFYENYQSLTPKQVTGLNKDTQNLIKTQKNLIETLNNMGPALKDGRQILDTFKNYFGSEQDIGKVMKNFKA